MLERKFVLVPMHSGTVGTSWAFFSALSGITQGTTASTRLGNKITLQSIRFTVFINTSPQDNVGTPALCRCVLYHNKMANGAVPSVYQVFDQDNMIANRAQTKLPQFSILRDYTHTFTPTAFDPTANKFAYGPPTKFVWTLYPKKVLDFSGNTGTIADLFKDDYGFACSATGSTAICDMIVTAQVIFTDA